MRTKLNTSRPRAAAAALGTAAWIVFLSICNAAAAHAAVGGTGGGSSGGGGGGDAPKLIESIKDNGLAALAAIGLLLVAVFALPPMIEGLRKKNLNMVLSTMAIAGVVFFFVGGPETALNMLKGLASDFAK